MNTVLGFIAGYGVRVIKPPNVKFGLSTNLSVDLASQKTSIYTNERTQEYKTNRKCTEAWNQIVNECKHCRIFFGDTRVEYEGDELKLNTAVAVISHLSFLYELGYVRVSCLNQTPTYFELCLSTTSNNVLDGYYHIIMKRTLKTLTLWYQKVSALSSGIPENKYIQEIQNKSVARTVNTLIDNTLYK